MGDPKQEMIELWEHFEHVNGYNTPNNQQPDWFGWFFICSRWLVAWTFLHSPIFLGSFPQKKSGTSPRKKQTITPIQKPPQSCWNGNSLIRLSAEPSVKSPDSMGFLWLGTWRPSDKTQKSTKNPSLPNRNPNLQFFCSEILGGLGWNMWKVSRLHYLFLKNTII